MFNYFDTVLVKKESFVPAGVEFELSELLKDCVNMLNSVRQIEGKVPNCSIINDILTVVFYLTKYLEAKGLQTEKYLEAFEKGVIKNMGNGIKTHALPRYSMFIANEELDTHTTKNIRDLCLEDIQDKAISILMGKRKNK